VNGVKKPGCGKNVSNNEMTCSFVSVIVRY
jgi:hypothetical protein